ncbi:MAG: response regulator transcription factor [Gemmatimonadota bacterium]|nr:MAG: response regulator transcription factor [Gemmatimonadota bacterium]
MKCLAIDDEPRALKVLGNYIEKVPYLELSGNFREALKALDYLQINTVDLIFLDINMPDLTGLQFLKSLIHKPLVIFTTAYSEYAVESYDFDAVDFLLKPIEFDRFLKATNRALKQFQLIHQLERSDISNSKSEERGKHTVLIKSGSETHQIKIEDIQYVEGAGNYVTFVTRDKKIMSLLTMKDVMDILPSQQFHRVHKSYIVGLKHIRLIERHHLEVRDKKIPIGRLYKESFLKAFR